MRRLVVVAVVVGMLPLIWAGRMPGSLGPLLTTFRASGAHAAGYSINDWVALPPARTTTVALDRLARAMAARAGCRSQVRLQSLSGALRARTSCPVPGGTLSLTAEAVTARGRYLVADETVSGGFTALSANRTRVRELLAQFGPVHESITLEGTLPGLANAARDRLLLSRVLAAANAREVNGERGREWVSISAYAERLGPSVTTQSQRINLEVALVREPGVRITLVLVGLPLIAITY
ncbi:MAG: YwmB family TATA-box binding protein [Clostridia bacterium]